MKKILSIILILILCFVMSGCEKDSTKTIEDITKQIIEKQQLHDDVEMCADTISRQKGIGLTEIEIDNVATLVIKTAEGEMISQDKINEMSELSIKTYYKWLECVKSGEPINIQKFNIYNIPKCESSNYIIKIRGQTPIQNNELTFDNCKFETDHWVCDCKDNTNKVVLSVNKNVSNIYDIFIQYYVYELTNDDKYNRTYLEDTKSIRTLNINDYQVNATVKNNFFRMPEFKNGSGLLIIITVVGGFFLSLIYITIKWLFSSSDNEIEKTSDVVKKQQLEQNKRKKDLDDEELKILLDRIKE